MLSKFSHPQSAVPLAGESLASRVLAITFAALLGVFVLGMVGFSPMAAAHNAAHDLRHAVSFPCH